MFVYERLMAIIEHGKLKQIFFFENEAAPIAISINTYSFLFYYCRLGNHQLMHMA
jgi:hypothetical protein